MRTNRLIPFTLVNAVWPNRYDRAYLLLKTEGSKSESEVFPRVNQSQIEPSNKRNFIEALKVLVKNGQYADLVSIHSDSRHRMHTDDPTLSGRFLPWHRIFLYELELRLNIAAGGSSNIRIPYWDWTVDRDIPELLRDYRPIIKNVPLIDNNTNPPSVVTETIKVKRRVGPWLDPRGNPVQLPTGPQITTLLTQPSFEDFTGVSERHHGTVHVWLGGTIRYPPLGREDVGTMTDPEISPADPCFWLHHSNIDRLWSKWLEDHQGGPDLKGTDAVMDPWSYRTDRDKIEDTVKFGYVYQ